MGKPTTIRLPEDLLRRLDRRARARGSDRATLVRQLLAEACTRDMEDEVLSAYAAGKLSLSAAAARLRVDPFAFLDLLRRRDLRVSVSLEDWIDSGKSL
jgi:predicted DNA-binding protein